MGSITFVPIEIPRLGKEGLSDRERDALSLGMARTMNFFGKEVVNTMNRHCEEIDEVKDDIGGKGNNPGLKSRSLMNEERSRDNKKWLNRILWTLIVTSSGEGVSIGALLFMKFSGG